MLLVAVASFTLLQSMVIPVLGQLAVSYDTDQATVSWVLTSYLLAASVATPLLGRLGDVVGKQRMLVVTLAALSVGSLLAALAPSIGWLIAARVVQGAGGGVLPLSFGIIRDEFPRAKVNGALSIVASLAAVGFGIGIVIAGPIVDSLGFHWLFWLPMIVTALAATAALVWIPRSRATGPARLPLAPAVLLAGWLVAVLLGVSQGNTWGWTSPVVIGLMVGGVALMAVWIWLEHRVRTPLIDMAMMRRRGVWTTNVVSACVGFGLFASFGFLPQFLQTPSEAGYGFDATIAESGWFLLPSAMASFAVGFLTARLVRGLGARVVVTGGALMTAVAFGLLALLHDQAWQIYAWTTLQGLGSGLVFSSLAGVVIASVPAHQTGVASGMNANIRTIGGSLGSAVMTGVVVGHVTATGLPSEEGYTIGFLVLAGAMLLAAAAAAHMPNIHDQPDDELPDDAPGDREVVDADPALRAA
ncbi:MFS transporter [Nocardioides sp. CFH 31398]|uniref:MFS transporter n=1 Tax=Nocardioides sp. CFH 31398 TaxID=2919579 RepID=UPI001F05C8A9|nr:MFS transporter [Nocardioides sp. CFH 31398]MCH1865820.1 MFS transporter [Nocardioides sp. CFH 31398]